MYNMDSKVSGIAKMKKNVANGRLWENNGSSTLVLRVTLDKGPGTKSSGTNLKQIEPWIGPFFTLKETFFSKVQWVCLKSWGSIQLSNIKNVCLTYERIKLIFSLFSFSLFFFMVSSVFWFFYSFLVLLHTIDDHRHKILMDFLLLSSCIEWLYKWFHSSE